jgi:hypothetical protein
MPISIKLEYKDEVLHVIALGKYTLASAIATLIEVLRTAQKANTGKIFIDCRPLATLDASTMETFQYAQAAADELDNLNFRPKLAYLFNSRDMNEMQQFGAIVAINRKVRVRIFDDYNAALNWLSDN